MNKKEPIVFFDFDNTITAFDVLDRIIERFSVNNDWMAFEEAWKAGKIGSKECLEGQLKSAHVTRPVLSQYLSTVEIDPFFPKILHLLKKKGIKSMIVSDSFSFFITEILRHNRIHGQKVYANKISFNRDKLIPSFPFASEDCSRCAHCKKIHIFERAEKMTIYVGDGLSDICPAEHADLVFAKEALLKYFRASRRPCIEFKDLEDVYATLLSSCP